MKFVDSPIRRLTLVATVAVAASACGGGSGNGFPDTTPPSVVSTDPPAGAVGVQLGDPVIATFNEPLSPASVNAASFQVTDNLSNPVSGKVSVSGRTARFTAQNALVKAALYHAMLTTAVKDAAGNALTTAFNWDFTTTADLWTSTAVNALTPPARTSHTAVWTGTEMIVWGGTDGVTTLNTGGRYDPTSPDATAWTATADAAPSNVPPARTDHTAVWTGGEMIVWGGDLGGSNLTNSGGRYFTATNTWTATSTTFAPLPRNLHTAVWDGGTMIAWGGSTSIGLTNSGGRYNPNTDAWTPTNLSGAPLPRTEHTVVWTGTQMIVWGGDQGGLLTSSGGSYRPATNSWSNVSVTGTPSPRSGHTAVWTGSEMIVWGGDDGFGPVATGGRHDPVTNTWRPMQNAPIARSGHEAVWTGSEMIVWGGEVSDNSGAAYNPAHDTWRSISIVAAPSGRTGHTAVWTGNEMVVWGGNDAALTNTGGRYAP